MVEGNWSASGLIHYAAMENTPRRFPAFFRWLLPFSFVLQIASIGVFHQYRTRPGNENFEFGWEMGRIGRSIAQGQGFSNPYGGDTGPTAWEPPLYPYLIGGVFKVFGVYSRASAWVLLSINSLFATLTCIPIFFIARKTFGESVAKWSALAWGLNPYVWYWSIHWIWDTTFTPFLLACIFLTSLELGHVARRFDTGVLHNGVPHVSPFLRDVGLPLWALFGALFGMGVLANPTLLIFLPFCGLWIWRQRYRRGLPSIAGIVTASVFFWAALSPWLIRNHAVFGHFLLRDDFGLQFRLGNGPYADGMLMSYLQPHHNKLEWKKFQEMGEFAYGESCKREAFDWIRTHPGRFVVISLKRFFYYWNGVPRETNSVSPVDFRTSGFLATSVLALWGLGRAVRQKRPAAWLFAGLVLTYPTVYYFVFPHARYRHPIEPELIILIVFLISEAVRRQDIAMSNER
jgi:4-amino-4-deoxy-L-arabinose transferase-like glycosyltransferase